MAKSEGETVTGATVRTVTDDDDGDNINNIMVCLNK